MNVSQPNGKSNKYSRISEFFFLAVLWLYLFFRISKITTFSLPYSRDFEKILLILMTIAVILQIPQKWRLKAFWLSLPIAVMYCLIWENDRYRFLLFLALITIGAVSVSCKKILGVYLSSVGFTVALAILGALSGGITNYVYMKDGYVRSSWGICYPTDFASILLFLAMAIWLFAEKMPAVMRLLMAGGASLCSWFIARSYTSTFCSLLLLVLMLFEIADRRLSSKKGWIIVRRITDVILPLSFPALGFLFLALIAAYQKGLTFAYVINNRLSFRLSYASEILQEVGWTLFGVPFKQVGYGGSTFSKLEYHFVDSSYPLIFIRYGLITLIVFSVLWLWMSKKAIRENHLRLCLVLFLIAVHSFMEHHFTEVHFNILLVMPFADFTRKACTQPALTSEYALEEKNRILSWIGSVVYVVCIALVLPYILSCLRTLFQASGAIEEKRQLLIFFVLLVTVALLIFGGYCFVRLFKVLINRNKVRKKTVAETVICDFIVLCLIIAVKYKFRQYDTAYDPILEADRTAVEQILQSRSGAFCSNIMPELYERKYGSVSRSGLSGEDLARFANYTVLVDRQMNSPVFIGSGFLFAEISEAHAIYTNDEEVINSLTKEGWHFTGYYSASKEVDLQALAEMNRLRQNEAGEIVVKGPKKPVKKGPNIGLYAGKYTVAYSLKIEPESFEEDAPVCTLRVQSYKGKKILNEVTVNRSQFDENGELTELVVFTSQNDTGFGFLVFPVDGQKMLIREIAYKQTPDYDVHGIYSADKKLIREEYYDLNGIPILNSNRYSFCDYQYDQAGNRIETNYYDMEGKPIECSGGYASVRKQYNIKKQVVKEAYYDTEGQPKTLANGYASVENKYDRDGNISVQIFYDDAGNRTVIRGGYAEIHREFNDDHKVIRESYYDETGSPVLLTSGYGGLEREYDEAGNVTMQRYLDTEGRPVSCGGYCAWRRRYNDVRQVINESYYDTDDQPVLYYLGYASYEQDFNGFGSVRMQRFYGTDGKPVMRTDGYFELRRDFNADGKVISERYYDTAGNPTLINQGYFEKRTLYDQNGKATLETYYDTEGHPVNTAEGYATVSYEYNEEGILQLQHYKDIDAKPVQAGSGYLHEYLEGLKNKNVTIFISIKDEAMASLTDVLLNDLKDLGVKTDLKGKTRNSFYAVLEQGESIEAISYMEPVSTTGYFGEKNIPYSISSAGYEVGNYSSIIIDGEEYSKNMRGMNIAVYDHDLEKVVDAVRFDTYIPEMTVTR